MCSSPLQYAPDDDNSFMKLEKEMVVVPGNPRSHPYGYYFENRPCSVLELELICDSIMSSKGIEYSLAKKLLKLIEKWVALNLIVALGSGI